MMKSPFINTLTTHKRTVRSRLLMLVTLMKPKLKLVACINSVNAWMLHNNLQLNNNKTKILVFHANHRPAPSLDCLQVASATLSPLIMQGTSNLSFNKQIEQICKFAFHSITLISKIRKFLSMETAKTFLHAFVTSKLDNCNVLLYGLPKHKIQRLQYVLNSAARLVTLSRKHDTHRQY